MLRLLRFFRVVAPVPRLMVATFALVTVIAAVQMVAQPRRAAAALTPVLLLQLFASSSGFSLLARRGYYDLILTTGESRLAIAMTHWMASMAPGIASWVCLGMVESMVTRDGWPSILMSGSVIAMILVSTLPWALTVTLPRFSAAIAWQLLVVLVAIGRSTAPTVQLWGTSISSASWAEVALAVLLYPPLAVGGSMSGAPALAVAPALLVAASAMACAFAWIGRHDIPLEAGQ